MVEHSAVNRRVASSNLARGAKPFLLNNLNRGSRPSTFRSRAEWCFPELSRQSHVMFPRFRRIRGRLSWLLRSFVGCNGCNTDPKHTACSDVQFLADGIAERRVACQSLFVRPSQHRYEHIRVVVDLDLLLILMESMETTDVLLQSSSPGNRHRKKERVEARIIETFTKVTSRRKNDTRFIEGNGSQGFGQLLSLSCAHPAFQNEDVRTCPMYRPARYSRCSVRLGKRRSYESSPISWRFPSSALTEHNRVVWHLQRTRDDRRKARCAHRFLTATAQ